MAKADKYLVMAWRGTWDHGRPATYTNRKQAEADARARMYELLGNGYAQVRDADTQVVLAEWHNGHRVDLGR